MKGVGSSCGACKFLRRKCTTSCVFSPYFCYNHGAEHFSAVHKVFGASNVSKLLMKLPLQSRSEAVISIAYEALARLHDPIYGCVAQIFALEQQVASLQEEIDQLWSYMSCESLDLPNHSVVQEIGNPNSGLPFYFQISDSIICDDRNQQRPTWLAAPEHGSSPSFGGQVYTCSFVDDPLLQNGRF